MTTLPAPDRRAPDPGVPAPRVSVVIPALNEAKNLPHVLAGIPADIYEVIVVDGHSVDDTLAVAGRVRPEARLLTQTRTGKGNALACGIASATGDIVVTLDADGSADPAEIARFVAVLVNGADFAKGTRFRKGGGSSDITRLRSIGNRALCVFVNFLYGTAYSDLCYGFNAFWRRVAPDLIDVPGVSSGNPVWGDGFEVETLLSIRVAQADMAVTEVPSFEYPRIHGASNLNAFRDGIRVLRTILAERVRARRRQALDYIHEDLASRAAEPVR